MKALYALCLSLAAFAFARPAQAELKYLSYEVQSGTVKELTAEEVEKLDVTDKRWHETISAEDGTQTTGYIATSFLTAYDFSGEDGQFTPPSSPEDYTEDNAVLTVVLVIIIVVLVIAGVAYLAYSSGSGKHGKKQQTDDGERKE